MNRVNIEKLVLRGMRLTKTDSELLRISLKAGLANSKLTIRPQAKQQSLVRLQVGPTSGPEQLGRLIAERIRQMLNQ